MAKSALPGQLVIRSGRWVWSTMWHTMMSQMAPRSKDGDYLRPDSQFRQQELEAEAGRYQLIVGLGCPWAHRTLVVRGLKGLEAAIPIALVAPSPEAGGWVFEQPEAGCRTVRQLYELTQPNYRGRSTVPILWDSRQQQIINNESAEIIVILNRAFQDFAQRPDLDLYPTALQAEIDQWNAKIYPAVNNGVYRCGFAQTQTAYDQAVAELFACLDELDSHLANQRYLCGSQLTLADLRLFTTLFRFDTVYHNLFKCSRRRIQDYPQLSGYLRDLYQLPGVAATCNLEAVKRDYYGNLFPLNPGGLIPDGPELGLTRPHGREALGESIQFAQ